MLWCVITLYTIIYMHNYDVGIEALPTPIITLLLPHDNYIDVAKAVQA